MLQNYQINELMSRTCGVRSPAGASVFLYTTASTPTLGYTLPIFQWVLGTVSPGAKRSGLKAGRSPASGVEVKNGGAIHPLLRTSSWRTTSSFTTPVM
jgi:hypothetical protein